jgi:molybdate transport system ATP-binding protein
MLELSVQKEFNGFKLHVELVALEERIIVLFGPSGAGKSLTLAAIAGLIPPDAGRIAVGSRVLFDAARGINLPPQQRHIGLVKQDLALFPHLTVAQNIAYGLFKQSRADAQERVQEFLRLTHLDGLSGRNPGELSGGQQQRVALARALANQPSLLLLDEPFSALDHSIRLELREELKTLQRRLGTTVLFITHDVGEAYALADYLAVIDRGRVLQLDQPDVILRAPQSLRVAEVVGVKNILPARVMSPSCVRVGERTLETNVENFSVGTRVFVCLRPERITLVRQDRQGPPLQNVIEGDLIEEQSDGANVSLMFRADEQRLRPDQSFDLHIDTPVYVYERLKLAYKKHWTISIKPNEIHLVKA